MQVCSFKPPEPTVHTVFSADSKHLLLDAQDRSLVVCALSLEQVHPCTSETEWRLSLVHTLRTPAFSNAATDQKRKSLRLRPTFGGKRGAFVAMGSSEGALRLWHWPSGTFLTEVSAHSGPVNCVAWSPTDPQLLVTASDDGTVGVWGPRLHGCEHLQAGLGQECML
jgi:WD40 repeat protein